MPASDPETVNRRKALAAIAGGGMTALAGCGFDPDPWPLPPGDGNEDDSDRESSSSPLKHAYFRVESPEEIPASDPSPQDIRFALVYEDAAPSASEVESHLNTSIGTVVADDSRLNWHRNVMGDEFEGKNAERAAEHGFTRSPADYESLVGKGGARVRGRIKGGALLPCSRSAANRPRFFGGRTRFPQITYTGKIDRDTPEYRISRRHIVHVQFTDGYTYHFPRDFRSDEKGSARYDFFPAKREVHGLSAGEMDTGEGSVSLAPAGTITSNLPTSGRKLAPSFLHRSHPYLGALRAIAQRRAFALTDAARATMGYEPVAQLIDDIEQSTSTVVKDIVVTLSPIPPSAVKEPENLAATVLTQEAPLIAASLFGRVAGAVAKGLVNVYGIIETAKNLEKATSSLEAWGEDILGEDGTATLQKVSNRCGSAPARYDEEVHQMDELDAKDLVTNCEYQAVNEFATTSGAVAMLSRFQYQHLLHALTTAPAYTRQAVKYEKTLEEIKEQCGQFAEDIPEAAAGQKYSTQLEYVFREVENLYERMDTVVDKEIDLLNDVTDSFTTPDYPTCPSTPTPTPTLTPSPTPTDQAKGVIDNFERERLGPRYEGDTDEFEITDRSFDGPRGGQRGLARLKSGSTNNNHLIYDTSVSVERGQTIRWRALPSAEEKNGDTAVAVRFDDENWFATGFEIGGSGPDKVGFNFVFHSSVGGSEETKHQSGPSIDSRDWYRVEFSWTTDETVVTKAWAPDGKSLGSATFDMSAYSDQKAGAYGIYNNDPWVKSYIDLVERV